MANEYTECCDREGVLKGEPTRRGCVSTLVSQSQQKKEEQLLCLNARANVAFCEGVLRKMVESLEVDLGALPSMCDLLVVTNSQSI